MKNKLLAPMGAALCCVCFSASYAEADTSIVLPIDAENVELRKVTLMPDGWPERATGVDTPANYYTSVSSTVQPMMDSGQVSPAAGAAGSIVSVLVLAAIDAGVDANRNGKLEGMLSSQSFNARSVFETSVVETLRAGAIEAKYQSGTRPKGEFFKIVATPEVKLDAAVDVMIHQYGFTLDIGGWVPSVEAQVKVHDIKTGELLMNEFVFYGRPGHRPTQVNDYLAAPLGPGSLAVIVPYNIQNRFADVDAYVEKEPERAVAALAEALEATAKTIAGLVLVAAPQDEAEPVATTAVPALPDAPAQ